MKCTHCAETGWVCESHPNRPWEGPHGCTCGGIGSPCPVCNVPADGKMPRMPAGGIEWRSRIGTRVPKENFRSLRRADDALGFPLIEPSASGDNARDQGYFMQTGARAVFSVVVTAVIIVAVYYGIRDLAGIS